MSGSSGVVPNDVLQGRNLSSIAKFIKAHEADERKLKIVVMVGAGISTSAGIPDFRSPETGLYSNLAKFNLPYPEAVFDIRFFAQNPKPFYALAKELNPGRFRPTPTHSFIRLLAKKGLLHMCFTQNIDTLERRAGVPADKIVEAHGSFASHACISCHKSYEDEKMQIAVERQEVPVCERCGSWVKPNITFFGEGLPPSFFQNIDKVSSASLIIILGTSLTVHPFASLPSMAPDTTPRLLINLEPGVGGIGSRPLDVVYEGECDKAVRELCGMLGREWSEELEMLWGETASSVRVDAGEKAEGSVSAEAEAKKRKAEASARAKQAGGIDEERKEVKKGTKEEKDAMMSAKMDALAKVVEARLKIIDEHVGATRADLELDAGTGMVGSSSRGTREVRAGRVVVQLPVQGVSVAIAEYDGHDDWDEYGLNDTVLQPDPAPAVSATPTPDSAEADADATQPEPVPHPTTGAAKDTIPSYEPAADSPISTMDPAQAYAEEPTPPAAADATKPDAQN